MRIVPGSNGAGDEVGRHQGLATGDKGSGGAQGRVVAAKGVGLRFVNDRCRASAEGGGLGCCQTSAARGVVGPTSSKEVEMWGTTGSARGEVVTASSKEVGSKFATGTSRV